MSLFLKAWTLSGTQDERVSFNTKASFLTTNSGDRSVGYFKYIVPGLWTVLEGSRNLGYWHDLRGGRDGFVHQLV